MITVSLCTLWLVQHCEPNFSLAAAVSLVSTHNRDFCVNSVYFGVSYRVHKCFCTVFWKLNPMHGTTARRKALNVIVYDKSISKDNSQPLGEQAWSCTKTLLTATKFQSIMGRRRSHTSFCTTWLLNYSSITPIHHRRLKWIKAMLRRSAAAIKVSQDSMTVE